VNFGLEKGSINMGKGTNDLDSTALAYNGSAYGISGISPVINMGNGQNSLNITAYAGKGYAYGVTGVNNGGTTINMGNGNGNLSITSETANGYAAYGVGGKSAINMGAGDDSIIIDVKGNNQAYGVSGSTVDLGAGDDSIHIAATGTGNNAYGLYSATLVAGEGSDSLYIAANGIDASHSIAMTNSVIALGTTTDRADSKGAGDVNTLEIYGNVESGSKIYGTAGVDHVDIYGNASKSTIDLGAGDDRLMITGNVSGMNLDGGANDALYFGNHAGDTVHLGDILGLGGDLGHSIAGGNNSIFTSGNKISGFESLLVDLADGNADSVSLDTLLKGLDAMRAAGNGAQSLVIMGDVGKDSLDLGNATMQHSGVTINGMDNNILFDHYQILDSHNNPQDIYVQQLISNIGG
jgi:hypothetical protein